MTPGTWPSISVALCTYRGELFVRDQLASIAAQTRLPDELVVCDDGSTDGTVAIVRDFAAQAPFPVHLWVNPERLGASLNFGQAIARCSHTAIALCDQDDVWQPRKLELLTAALAGPRRPGLVFSDGELIDEHAEPIGRTCWQAVGLTAAQVSAIGCGWALPTIVHRQRHYGGTVTGATMAFVTELRDLVLPIPAWTAEPGAVLIHDAWITLLAAAVAPVSPVSECLIGYRRHVSQAAGLPVVDREAPPGVFGSLRRATERDGRSGPAGGRLPGPPAPKVDELRWVSEVAARLEERKPDDAERAIATMAARRAHLQARVTLPGARARRLPTVARELASGRYRSYSSGLRSAVRDLSR